ncbi:glycoside hydrolase family 27 protein [Kutzneria sp. CA-103260]|uniref:glycoside hydrolase family 27 protein n=1 Tax=Kutzneria sp. CA-103260 TaxID=2802641 RepID=UPI001BAB24B2|nr:glycoside hydrolase family 27 protein [Kutzneria sp. CA-103260]QUQ66172.1 Alpha galactosidase A [Kutzneria sp. CA-103260]
MFLRRLTLACAIALGIGSLAAPTATAEPDHQQPNAPVVSPTPYMGWNSYFGLGAPTEDNVHSVAQFLVSSGLAKSGYDIVWLDGGWQASPPRDGQGNLAVDPARWPSGMDNLVKFIHGLGLKAGIYTDAGAYDGKNCGLGSGGGYYQRDADQFARWGFDAIKIDFLCGLAQKLDPAVAFHQFSQAVANTGRKMILNLCDPVTSDWGVPDWPSTRMAGYAYTWGPDNATSWRTDTDVAFGNPTPGEWPDILRNMDDNAAHPEAQSPGHYNDPDYLIPMRPFPTGGTELTEEESTTQFVMWAEMGSPLIIGADPRTLPQSMLDTLKNPEILAVDQDPLAIQGVRVADSGGGNVYSKVLSGKGNRAVVLLNRSDSASSMTVDFAKAGLSGNVKVRDLRARADKGTTTGSYTATVPAHGTVMLKLSGTDLAPGNDLGGNASDSPALVRFDDTHAYTFVRDASGQLAESTVGSGKWAQLGGPTHNQILGQPAAYASGADRVDVFVRGTDNAAYQRTFQNGHWGNWVKLGGNLTDSPTVAFTSPTQWTLVARGADGKVWQRTSGGYGTWSSLGSPSDQPIYGRPSAVADANGTHIVVRAFDDSAWLWEQNTGWTGLGGVISTAPTLLATSGRLYMFARASDYTLWQRNFTDGSWGGWFPRGEFASNAIVGTLGVAAGANGSAWVAVRGVDDHVHQTVL